jgi:isopentenyldiphosphate isomerase
LRTELGLEASLEPRGRLVYRAICPATGLVEHELDEVFFATTPRRPRLHLNTEEVMDIVWLDARGYEQFLRDDDRIAPWLSQVMAMATEWG